MLRVLTLALVCFLSLSISISAQCDDDKDFCGTKVPDEIVPVIKPVEKEPAVCVFPGFKKHDIQLSLKMPSASHGLELSQIRVDRKLRKAYVLVNLTNQIGIQISQDVKTKKVSLTLYKVDKIEYLLLDAQDRLGSCWQSDKCRRITCLSQVKGYDKCEVVYPNRCGTPTVIDRRKITVRRSVMCQSPQVITYNVVTQLEHDGKIVIRMRKDVIGFSDTITFEYYPGREDYSFLMKEKSILGQPELPNPSKWLQLNYIDGQFNLDTSIPKVSVLIPGGRIGLEPMAEIVIRTLAKELISFGDSVKHIHDEGIAIYSETSELHKKATVILIDRSIDTLIMVK